MKKDYAEEALKGVSTAQFALLQADFTQVGVDRRILPGKRSPEPGDRDPYAPLKATKHGYPDHRRSTSGCLLELKRGTGPQGIRLSSFFRNPDFCVSKDFIMSPHCICSVNWFIPDPLLH